MELNIIKTFQGTETIEWEAQITGLPQELNGISKVEYFFHSNTKRSDDMPNNDGMKLRFTTKHGGNLWLIAQVYNTKGEKTEIEKKLDI